MLISSEGVRLPERFVHNKNSNQNNVSFGHLKLDYSKLDKLNPESKIYITKFIQTAFKYGEKIRNSIFNGLEFLFLRGHFDKKTFQYIETYAEKFKNTPEGIRRNSMTEDEIAVKTREIFDKACEELEIPENQRPSLGTNSRKSLCIGGYSLFDHSIGLNPYFYQTGLIDLESVIMHEVTHAREALLRAGVIQDKIDKIIGNQLIALIKTATDMPKVTANSLRFIETPKMPEEMKNDFADFTKNNLQNRSKQTSYFIKNESDNFRKTVLSMLDSKYLLIPRLLIKFRFGIDDFVGKMVDKVFTDKLPEHFQKIKDELNSMIKKYPEFTWQYKNEKEAYVALTDYSLSHINRFENYTCTALKKGIFFPKRITVETLRGRKLDKAEQSLKNFVELRDGNLIVGKENNFFTNLFYFFSEEEIKAETNGQNFLIKNLVKKYYEMKAKGTLTPEKESYIKLSIQKANLEIAIRQKGREYLELYKQFLSDNKYNDHLETCIREYQSLKIQQKETEDKMNELK